MRGCHKKMLDFYFPFKLPQVSSDGFISAKQVLSGEKTPRGLIGYFPFLVFLSPSFVMGTFIQKRVIFLFGEKYMNFLSFITVKNQMILHCYKRKENISVNAN